MVEEDFLSDLMKGEALEFGEGIRSTVKNWAFPEKSWKTFDSVKLSSSTVPKAQNLREVESGRKTNNILYI